MAVKNGIGTLVLFVMKWKLTIWLAFLCCCAPVTSFIETPMAIQGQLDLQSWDFNQNLPLSGEWVFYWKQWIQPQIPLSENRSDEKKYLRNQRPLIISKPLEKDGKINWMELVMPPTN